MAMHCLHATPFDIVKSNEKPSHHIKQLLKISSGRLLSSYSFFFFFFLISKKDAYSKIYFMQRSTKHIKDYKKRKKSKNRDIFLFTFLIYAKQHYLIMPIFKVETALHQTIRKTQ